MECKIRNIVISYEIIGEGKPIILLHGYAFDHRVMIGCMEPILSESNHYKRVYMDLPGMGKSESSDWITNSDSMLTIVIDFINDIIPNENFLLAGESYGGYLSRGIIYHMADRVEGALFICPVIIADNNKRNLPKHKVLVKDTKLLSEISQEEASDFNQTAVVQSEITFERYQNEIISGFQMADHTFLNCLKENGYEFSINVDKVNQIFDKPALFLLGRQDSSVGYKDAWNILDNFSRATFAVLDLAGHNLQIEQEALFNSFVKEWLNRVEENGIISK